MPGPLLVCDLPLLMYRSFFALPRSIKGVEGRPVNAILGTTNAVLAACDEHRPRAVVLCDGAEAAAYRLEAFPAYHAGREPMPKALAWQFSAAASLWKALGWKLQDAGDLEADDLMATLARLEERAGARTLILTGDRDLLQCASAKTDILLLKPGKGALLTGPNEVLQATGVAPGLVPDLIALKGDPSDGIPGAPGIGEKTARELLSRHGSLEAVISGAAQEKPRTAASLTENAQLISTFKDVATVQTVRGIRRPPDRPLNRHRGAKAAEALGMKRLAARLTE